MSKRKKRWLGCLGVFLVIFTPLAIFYGPALWDVVPELLGAMKGPEMRKYEGTNRDNLKAIYTAITQFHDSEERFPESGKWMDEIKGYIQTNDLTEEEAGKKLINPRLAKAAGEFGYALNDAVSKKYKGDIKDPKTILVFESKSLQANAHGKPEVLKPEGGGEAITITGEIVKLPK